MTPQAFLEQLNRYSRQDDPDRLLAFAARHLDELMSALTVAEMRRVNALGEWAATSISLRQAREAATLPNSVTVSHHT